MHNTNLIIMNLTLARMQSQNIDLNRPYLQQSISLQDLLSRQAIREHRYPQVDPM